VAQEEKVGKVYPVGKENGTLKVPGKKKNEGHKDRGYGRRTAVGEKSLLKEVS